MAIQFTTGGINRIKRCIIRLVTDGNLYTIVVTQHEGFGILIEGTEYRRQILVETADRIELAFLRILAAYDGDVTRSSSCAGLTIGCGYFPRTLVGLYRSFYRLRFLLISQISCITQVEAITSVVIRFIHCEYKRVLVTALVELNALCIRIEVTVSYNTVVINEFHHRVTPVNTEFNIRHRYIISCIDKEFDVVILRGIPVARIVVRESVINAVCIYSACFTCIRVDDTQLHATVCQFNYLVRNRPCSCSRNIEGR